MNKSVYHGDGIDQSFASAKVSRSIASGQRRAYWAACLLSLAVAMGAAAAQDDGEAKRRDLARREAVILWIGLGILSVLVVGIGLIWGVSRAARQVLRKRPPAHTEMPNIWYLNPPGKRRQDDS
jgi:hypothetical protein